MVSTAMEDKDGGVVLANALSVGRIRKVNKPENKYGLNVG